MKKLTVYNLGLGAISFEALNRLHMWFEGYLKIVFLSQMMPSLPKPKQRRNIILYKEII